MSDNQFKLIAQYKKASAIATVLRPIVDAGVLVAADLPDDHGRLAVPAARLAGTNVPSETTWALVVHMLTADTS